MEITDRINSIIELWRTEGLKISQPNLPSQVLQFEAHHCVGLPADFNAYLLTVNGMEQNWQHDTDSRGFCFWPLQRICSVFDDLKKNGRIDLSERLRSYFIFADYLQWSWAYAIKLSGEEGSRNSIVKVDGPERLLKISDSFSEFIELYLADAKRLYDPPENELSC